MEWFATYAEFLAALDHNKVGALQAGRELYTLDVKSGVPLADLSVEDLQGALSHLQKRLKNLYEQVSVVDAPNHLNAINQGNSVKYDIEHLKKLIAQRQQPQTIHEQIQAEGPPLNYNNEGVVGGTANEHANFTTPTQLTTHPTVPQTTLPEKVKQIQEGTATKLPKGKGWGLLVGALGIGAAIAMLAHSKDDGTVHRHTRHHSNEYPTQEIVPQENNKDSTIQPSGVSTVQVSSSDKKIDQRDADRIYRRNKKYGYGF